MALIDSTIPQAKANLLSAMIARGFMDLGPVWVRTGEKGVGPGPILKTGTCTATASATITGTGTAFTAEFKKNQFVKFGTLADKVLRILDIVSDTEMLVDEAVTITNDTISWVHLTLLGRHDSCKITLSTSKADLKSAQTGDQAYDRITVGSTCAVAFGLVEPNLISLSEVTQGLTFTTDPLTGVVTRVRFKQPIGSSDRRTGKRLYVTTATGTAPGDESDASLDTWIFNLSAPQGNYELTHDAAGQRMYAVTFNCYPDDTTGETFFLGDEL